MVHTVGELYITAGTEDYIRVMRRRASCCMSPCTGTNYGMSSPRRGVFPPCLFVKEVYYSHWREAAHYLASYGEEKGVVEFDLGQEKG